MKLPRSEPTSGPASLSNQFISFWLVLQPVERSLHRTFYVITEFSGFVLSKSFQTKLTVWYCTLDTVNLARAKDL